MSLLLSLCAQIIRWYQNVSFEVIVNKTIMVVPFFHQHDSIISLKKSGIKSEALELNSEHSHFIIMEQNTDLKELENFRLRVEERLLMPIGRGKRYRKVQMFDPTLSEFIDESFTVIMKWNLMSRVLPFLLLYLFSNAIFNFFFFLFIHRCWIDPWKFAYNFQHLYPHGGPLDTGWTDRHRSCGWPSKAPSACSCCTRVRTSSWSPGLCVFWKSQPVSMESNFMMHFKSK